MADDGFVVIEHRLDTEAGVYRLVVGAPVTEWRPVFEDGEVVLEDVEGEDGETTQRPRLEEVVVEWVGVHDYVFAAGDDRWFAGKGKGRRRREHEAVAQEQQRIVGATIGERVKAAKARTVAAPGGVELPGKGRKL